MPLLKLWNSLTGQAAKEQTTESSVSPKTSVNRLSEAGNAKTKASIKAKSGVGFSLFGGGQHAGLRKLVKPTSARSVLEIGVGDGSRALAVLETLSKSGREISYIGVDEFELAGAISLKQFHQTLRMQGIRPQLLPGTPERGIMRVAHTLGTVDLIMVAEGSREVNQEAATSLMHRICHQETVVLMEKNDVWSRVATPESIKLRRAA